MKFLIAVVFLFLSSWGGVTAGEISGDVGMMRVVCKNDAQCVNGIKEAYDKIVLNCGANDKNEMCRLWLSCHSVSSGCESAIRSKIKGIDSMVGILNHLSTYHSKKPNNPFTNNHLIKSEFKKKMELCAHRGTQRGDKCTEEKDSRIFGLF